jgi:hypothetical protein
MQVLLFDNVFHLLLNVDLIFTENFFPQIEDGSGLEPKFIKISHMIKKILVFIGSYHI